MTWTDRDLRADLLRTCHGNPASAEEAYDFIVTGAPVERELRETAVFAAPIPIHGRPQWEDAVRFLREARDA